MYSSTGVGQVASELLSHSTGLVGTAKSIDMKLLCYILFPKPHCLWSKVDCTISYSIVAVACHTFCQQAGHTTSYYQFINVINCIFLKWHKLGEVYQSTELFTVLCWWEKGGQPLIALKSWPPFPHQHSTVNSSVSCQAIISSKA